MRFKHKTSFVKSNLEKTLPSHDNDMNVYQCNLNVFGSDLLTSIEKTENILKSLSGSNRGVKCSASAYKIDLKKELLLFKRKLFVDTIFKAITLLILFKLQKCPKFMV